MAYPWIEIIKKNNDKVLIDVNHVQGIEHHENVGSISIIMNQWKLTSVDQKYGEIIRKMKETTPR